MTRIAWTRLDEPGHETAELHSRDNGFWHLTGHAELRTDSLDYSILCDPQWRTVSAKVNSLTITADNGVWRLDGVEVPEVAGCIDIDLNFSPSTNLVPIRRLNLGVGEEAAVRAAWLRYPSFRLEPLEQRYRRIDAAHVHYESAGGTFQRTLTVNEHGFVTEYPGLWVASDRAL